MQRRAKTILSTSWAWFSKSCVLPVKRMSALLDECEQLCNIIASSLITAKKNRDR